MNTSIDIPENRLQQPSPAGFTDEIYDEIESITEFFIDETLDQTLPDQTGNDEQGMLKKSVTFDFSLPEKREKVLAACFRTCSLQLTGKQDEDDLPAGFASIFTPPPDLA